jgi:murein DD-endopeptidase MepM/ murein hydrolase activator NlpD
MVSNINFNDLIQQVANLFHKSPKVNTAPTSNAPSTSSSGFQPPIKGSYFNSGNYSPNQGTDYRHPKGHQGVDLRASGGTAVYPIAPGIVTYVGTDNKGGNVVNITHPQGVRAYYAHLGTVSVNKGDKVNFDTVIGSVGNSGDAKATWPHLHIQVWKNNQLQDPGSFFTVPAYTTPNVRVESPWASQDAKMQASKFNMQEYRERNQKTASKVDELLALSEHYGDSVTKKP